MSQDTRKDPRAKIVSLNVRYKSATVDEFIENHSLDVSRGGLFIKTSTPFAQGTLLKFEIRLASDQTVIAGVGRVVWKREPGQAAADRPAGMGVKFIKIDDKSRATIERLVGNKANAGIAYTGGDDEVTTVRPSTPPRLEMPSLKPTVSGMPAVSEPPASLSPDTPTVSRASLTAEATATPMVGAGGSSFFPQTDSAADMPPPQERTMMRQAAELLEEALKASGGSMEEVAEVGQNPLFQGLPQPPAGAAAPEPRTEEERREEATIGGFPASVTPAPAVVTPAQAAAEASGEAPRRSTPPPDRERSVPPPRTSDAPRTSLAAKPVRATDMLADSAPKKSGVGLYAALGTLLVGGGLVYAYQAGMLADGGKSRPTPPAPTETAVVKAAAPSTSTAAAPTASASASAPPATSVAAIPSASTSAAAAVSVAASPPEVAEVKPAKPPREAKPVEAKPVEAKPVEAKPVEAKPVEAKPVEAKPAEAKPAEAKPAEEKPVEEKPAEPKPPKKPRPKKDDSDNPY